MTARNRLLAPILALPLAAALLWGASRLTWVHVVADNDQSGRAVREISGGRWQPALVPVALGALAGVAAVALARGLVARVVGVVLVVLALAAVVPAGGALTGVDREHAHAAVTRDAQVARTSSGSGGGGDEGALPAWSTVTEATVRPAGPALAAGAAVALAVAGVSLLVRPPRRVARDDRYQAPTRRREPAPEDVDTGRGLWDRLDEGDDPTG